MDLTGKIIVSMPSLEDERFFKTVIYMCAHSSEGSMGIIINKKIDYDFDDSFLNEIAFLKKTFRFEDGTIIEIKEIQKDFPLMIFYPSGENSGGQIDIYYEEYIQRIVIKNHGKVTNEVISY